MLPSETTTITCFSTVRKTTFIETLSCLGEMKIRYKNPGEKNIHSFR